MTLSHSLWGLAPVAAYAGLGLATARLNTANFRWALLAVWLIHGAALLAAFSTLPLRFGFGPALSVTAWLVLTVYGIESRLVPGLRARWGLTLLGALAAALAWLWPGPELHITASPWLALHGILGLAAYGLLALAVLHAWLLDRVQRRLHDGQPLDTTVPLLTMERLTFGFVWAGWLLLTASFLVGALLGPLMHEALARWDHKVVFGILAWLTFAALLVARRFLGWRGRKAVRMVYLGAGLLLLAYVGSRFVVEIILHRS